MGENITSLINKDCALTILRERMNDEMVAAAEPIIEKALKEIEATMRKKLGSMVIAFIEKSMEIDGRGDTLRILVKHSFKGDKE